MIASETIQPFGLVVTIPTSASLSEQSAEQLRSAVSQHRLVVLRGIEPPSDEEMLAFCKQLGNLLEWQFGTVNELKARPDAKNYLYTHGAVPFHWDGAFIGRVPHYIFFHCQDAPPANSGGETTFCDTVRLLGKAETQRRQTWQRVSITYSTEKIVHYGGSFTSPMIALHPVTGETVLRYAEPVSDLNPVRLSIQGLPAEEHELFVTEMHRLLNDPAVCYAHQWRTGDIVIADNHALLHGRRAYQEAAPRHLRRVNIL